MKLVLTLHEPWQAGTGRGDGPECDAIVVRTDEGLPYLPGRTLKGLLREALETLVEAGHLDRKRVAVLLGDPAMAADDPEPADKEEDDRRGELRRFKTTAGALRIGSAQLGADDEERERWRHWAGDSEHDALKRDLCRRLSSTSMDPETGTARQRTLRTVEVAVPMTLVADIDWESPEAEGAHWRDDIRRALPLLRQLGGSRHRGFGRCTAMLEDGGAA
ncbi:MAG: RAMP superfamily CRISPR-associated protein [Acidobacteriota bacterium]